MDAEVKNAILNRLKSVVGHLNGVVSMVEQDRYCIDVIKQVQATQAALAKVNQLILDNHLHTCVTTAVRGDEAEERERVLSEITEIFSMSNRS